MASSKDLPPSTTPFVKIFMHNQFRATPKYPSPGTSLSTKTALITGGNTGLGYEAAVQLLSLDLTHLILAVRSLPKGEAAATRLRALYPTARISVWHLDMTSYPSIQALARRCAAELPRLDIALLNAGVIKYRFTTIAPGAGAGNQHEETLLVNYLSTWLLAILLLPVLKPPAPATATDKPCTLNNNNNNNNNNDSLPASTRSNENPQSDPEPGRLTIVSAALTLAAKFPERTEIPLLKSFSNPTLFTPSETYNSTKLLSHFLLWTIHQMISPREVIINLADPAWCRGTNLAREVPRLLKPAVKIFALTTGRTPALGASCFVDALVNKGAESHGCFLMSWAVHPFAAIVYSEEGRRIRERLWRETLDELAFAGVGGILEDMKKGTRMIR